MRIGSILENQKIEKRISITPEIVKKYISLGFEIFLSENYGLHLGIKDDEYLKLGAKVEKDESRMTVKVKTRIKLAILFFMIINLP